MILDIVGLPWGIAVLNSIDGLVKRCGVCPRGFASVFHHNSSPDIENFIDIGSRTLSLDKVIIRKVEFCPRFKRPPRIRCWVVFG